MVSYTLKQLADRNAEDLIEGLEGRKMSILKTAGGKKLLAEMYGVGLLCRAVLALVRIFSGGGRKGKDIAKMRQKLASFLAWGAPCKVVGKLNRNAKCLVMGFNHPSLGEIIRFIYIHLKYFPDRYSLFPVNLPWYEALAPRAELLYQMGIVMVPILTPSTMKKLKKVTAKSDIEALDSIASMFNHHYMKTIRKMAEEDRCLIWVAPSATRQATVFKNVDELNDRVRIAPQTITLLAMTLKRAKVEDCEFVPIGVAPDKKCGRGLNLFKNYKLAFAASIEWNYVETLLGHKSPNHRGSMLEFKFLERISWALMNIKRQDLVCNYKEAS